MTLFLSQLGVQTLVVCTNVNEHISTNSLRSLKLADGSRLTSLSHAPVVTRMCVHDSRVRLEEIQLSLLFAEGREVVGLKYRSQVPAATADVN